MDQITQEPDLVLDTRPLVYEGKTEDVTIKLGQNIVPNQVSILARDADGEYVELTALDATDGTSRPVAVIAHAVDATAEAIVSHVYVSGRVNESDLSFQNYFTLDSILTGAPTSITIKQALRNAGFKFFTEGSPERDYS